MAGVSVTEDAGERWRLLDCRHGRINESAADVGLLVTTDGSEQWNHLHVFEGPNVGDVNERHVLDLRVD